MSNICHNLIGADFGFNDFHTKIRQKLDIMTYTLFLHTTKSSQNIFIPESNATSHSRVSLKMIWLLKLSLSL
jgi:hypothetical protein